MRCVRKASSGVFDHVIVQGASKSDSVNDGSAPQRASPPPPRRWRATALLGEAAPQTQDTRLEDGSAETSASGSTELAEVSVEPLAERPKIWNG